MSFISNLGRTVYVSSKVNYKKWFFFFFFFNRNRLKWGFLKLRFWSALQDVCITKLISMHLWELYQENDFYYCLLSQFIFSSSSPSHPHSSFVFFSPPSCSVILLFTACSGWQHMGSSDCPVPHTGRVHYMLLLWGELSPEGGPGALQRLYAATRL